ncbi:MAG: hypothetical protein KME04_14995 [Pleurocapsa minor GSE-CHR-MK-17-07R]|nr:hypothetical protein [Pleurocapsa minor GSE-CHR-MK 17-07R]
MLLILAAVLLTLHQPALAANFAPGCTEGEGNAVQLQTSIVTASANNQADTITLAAGCVYAISQTLEVAADNGNLLTISGNGATISGGDFFQVMTIASGAEVLIQNVVIAGGFSDAFGGAINSVGTLTIEDSIIRNSSAFNGGGGIFSDGVLTINSSQIVDNSAFAGAGIENVGTATITNSLIAGNGGSQGGGIYNIFGSLTVDNSSVVNNGGSDGSALLNELGTVTVRNSILADSYNGPECSSVGGTITFSFSLVEDATCGVTNGVNGNITGADPGLDPEYKPASGASVVVDEGSNALVPVGLTTDLAGSARILGSSVDIGAYEFVPLVTATPSPTATNTATATPSPTLTLTASPTLEPTNTFTPSPTLTPSLTATPTVTLTPSATLTPPAGDTLSAVVALQGRAGAGLATTFTLELYEGSSLIGAYSPVTDTSGTFTFTGLPTGTYTAWLKHPQYLATVATITLPQIVGQVSFGTLLAGDANDDNVVTLLDFSLLATSFGLNASLGGFEPRVDFNGDNAITLLDFSLLASNFNQTGAARP